MTGQSFDDRRPNDSSGQDAPGDNEPEDRPLIALVPLSDGSYISMTDLATPEVAARYRRTREELGLSHLDVAERILETQKKNSTPITPSDVEALETSPERAPLEVFEAVAAVLGQSVPQLMDEPMITIRPPRRPPTSET